MITINRKLVHIELPKDCLYHVIVVKQDVEIVMKCSGHGVYAPVTGTVASFSSRQRLIKIMNTLANVTIRLPRTDQAAPVFYINQGENIVRGLKLAELARQSGDLLIISVHLNTTCRFKIEKGSS